MLKPILGAVSLVIMVAAYANYIRQAARKDGIQPHPFSWLLWGLVTGVAFFAQQAKGGGAGSWVTGATSLVCILIAVLSLLRHRWRYSWFDWLCLALGILVFGSYLASKNPTESAILATITDVLGYGSTVKKAWVEPYKDSAVSFSLNSAKFIPAIFALDSYSLATYLYPLTLVAVNGGVALLLIIRRKNSPATAVGSIARI